MEPIWYKSWPEGVPTEIRCPDTTLPEIVKGHARSFPHREAINFYGYSISYGSFEQLTAAFADSLLRLGVLKGDRVCLFMENCPQLIISTFAVWRIGGVVVFANPMYKEEELVYQLTDSGSETIILLDMLYPVLHRIRKKTLLKNVIITGYRDFLPEAPGLPLHPSLDVPRQYFPCTLEMLDLLECDGETSTILAANPNDTALLQYSAGTTGTPKGAIINHHNILFSTICSALWLKGENGIHLAVLPLFHVTGLVHSLIMPLYNGSTIILLALYDTETVIMAIEKYRCTHWVSVATMNIAVVNHPDVKRYNLSSLFACVSGGAPISLKIHREFKEITGASLAEFYGLSETISLVTMNPLERPRLGSVGIPVMNTSVKIADLNDPGREVSLGEMGELMVKGPQVTRGYWMRSEESSCSIKGGWLATGDIVMMDSDGYIYIVGRKKELIKASGYSVFPGEVERYIREHPAVAEVAVAGIPSLYRGENIKAFVVLKHEYANSIRESDIIEWSRTKMASYKYPRKVEFLPDLPVDGSGKIMRHLLPKE